jgi:hypothetical protein
MRAKFYLYGRDSPMASDYFEDGNLPEVGETTVLRDGVYRITDVVVDDNQATAEINLTTNGLFSRGGTTKRSESGSRV